MKLKKTKKVSMFRKRVATRLGVAVNEQVSVVGWVPCLLSGCWFAHFACVVMIHFQMVLCSIQQTVDGNQSTNSAISVHWIADGWQYIQKMVDTYMQREGMLGGRKENAQCVCRISGVSFQCIHAAYVEVQLQALVFWVPLLVSNVLRIAQLVAQSRCIAAIFGSLRLRCYTSTTVQFIPPSRLQITYFH